MYACKYVHVCMYTYMYVSNLINLCHDISVLSHIEGVDFTGIRVQVIQEGRIIRVLGEVTSADLVRVEVGTQPTASGGYTGVP